MIEDIYAQHPVLLGFGLFALLMAAGEAGLRFGRWYGKRMNESVRSVHLTAEGALLGLLALLLGFTFAMSAQRYEERKKQVILEANAIGTVYLRADMLPPDHTAAVKALLRDYLDARMEMYRSRGDEVKMSAAIERSSALHRPLWAHAVDAAKSPENGAVDSMFSTALNEMIDVHTSRVAAIRDRVPDVIMLMLLLFSTAGMASVGFVFAIAGRRQMAPKVALSLLIVLTIMVITDLDSPRTGFIRVSQEPMLELEAQMKLP